MQRNGDSPRRLGRGLPPACVLAPGAHSNLTLGGRAPTVGARFRQAHAAAADDRKLPPAAALGALPATSTPHISFPPPTMSRSFIFSSESVGEGHPDKVCDTISDAVLDACLRVDPKSRVACESFAKSNLVVVGGEITIPKIGLKPIGDVINIDKTIRDAIRGIGYVNNDDVFHADRVFINNYLTTQSPDIAQGVDARKVDGKKTAEQGAGDQGIMFGYACNETEELMPAPIMFAHRLGRELTRIRKAGRVKWLRPDAKSQVSVEYVDGKPTRIVNVVISTQHAADVSHAEIEKFCIEQVVRKVLDRKLLTKDTEYLINPTGKFVVGGPQGDSGLTGRKIIVDTYGGMGRHGGGAFSGKDPSKVDRSAAYLGRWVAKNIVAAGLAERCEVQFAYAIGHPRPVSVHVDTFGTGAKSDEAILEALLKVFSFKPADIVKQLNLLRPIYGKSTNYGHFGKSDPDLTWERTDKVEALKKALR
jgi:S-adenosylmethionine synthetase